MENPFAKTLQKFLYNYTQAYYRQSYIFAVTKYQNFCSKMLFDLFTRQSITLYDNHCDTDNTQY